MNKLYFTRKGLQKLHDEIAEFEKRVKGLQSQSAEVAETGGNAWHDNASYDNLVIQLRGADQRLADAHKAMNRAVIVDPPSTLDRVTIGTRVKIRRDGEEEEWEIAGYGESDFEHNIIAYNTPLAILLMKKQRGDKTQGIIGEKKAQIEICEITRGEK